eukprot:11216396-Alexandrium_andersonii.AAC.1
MEPLLSSLLELHADGSAPYQAIANAVLAVINNSPCMDLMGHSPVDLAGKVAGSVRTCLAHLRRVKRQEVKYKQANSVM